MKRRFIGKKVGKNPADLGSTAFLDVAIPAIRRAGSLEEY